MIETFPRTEVCLEFGGSSAEHWIRQDFDDVFDPIETIVVKYTYIAI